MASHGGILTAADFARYHSVRREPLVSRYRDWTIVGFPPPSSGGVHVAQMLGMLERFDLTGLGHDSDAWRHLVAEAMKRAFADRGKWLGDPDFVAVPRGLLDRDYLAARATSIDRDRAMPVASAGEPPNAAEDIFPPAKHTTHVSAADADGWWVACTSTVNTTFGSKVVVPGTGIVLNNEMDDFVAKPGARNAFGLVGGDANAIAPGKRPLSSMSPTIVLRDGRPVLAVGAAGGPTIISQVLLAIIQTLDFGAAPEDALARPRFHHQWSPDRLRIERGAGAAVLESLSGRGHETEAVDSIGASTLVTQPLVDGPIGGAAEPRLVEASVGGL